MNWGLFKFLFVFFIFGVLLTVLVLKLNKRQLSNLFNSKQQHICKINRVGKQRMVSFPPGAHLIKFAFVTINDKEYKVYLPTIGKNRHLGEGDTITVVLDNKGRPRINPYTDESLIPATILKNARYLFFIFSAFFLLNYFLSAA